MTINRWTSFIRISFVGLLACTVFFATMAAKSATQLPVTTIEQLVAGCNTGNGELQTVKLTADLVIEQQRLAFANPCRVQLESGVDLTLDTSVIDSRHLLLSDSASGSGSRVTVTASSLTGRAHTGFSLDFANPGSSLLMAGSTIDYPLSVWIRAVGKTGGRTSGGLIEVDGSTFRSQSPTTEGVMFVASESGGSVTINNSRIEVPEGAIGLAFADSCHTAGTPGLPLDCGPSSIKR